jgi:hypothetical protein
METPKGITKEELTTKELRQADEDLTAFLKVKSAGYRALMEYEKEHLPANHHVDVRFYMDGTVKVQTIKDGSSARGCEHICGLFLTRDRDVDEWVNYAIENRIYRL